MKKILCILLFAVSLFAAPKKINNIDDEKAMSHINYIQYSLNKIRNSKTKATINAELDAILNTINPTSLKYDALIEAYQNLTQSTLMSLKLNIEQEEALQAEIHNRRSNAIYSTFEGLGASFLAPSPLSIGMAALQAGFNYARTQSEITNDSLKNANKLDAEAIRIIDIERIGIFLSAAKVFKDKKCDNTHFINETMMQSLSRTAFELDSVAKLDSLSLKQDSGNYKSIHKAAIKTITYLSEKDIFDLFEFFLPYYLTLLKAHYYLTEIDNSHYDVMDSLFKEMEDISYTNYHRFYQKNDFLKEAAQYMILAEMQKGPYSNKNLIMNRYVSVMDRNIQATLENMINHKYFLTSIYEYLGMHDNTLECLNYIHDVGAEEKMGTSLERKMLSTDCKNNSNSDECGDLETLQVEQEKLQKRKKYNDEAKDIFKRIQVSKNQKMLTIKSPIPLDRIDVQCFVFNDKGSTADARECNSELKEYKERTIGPIYGYYFKDYYERSNIYLRIYVEAKDVNDNWAFYGVIEQTTDDGNYKYSLPDGVAVE